LFIVILCLSKSPYRFYAELVSVSYYFWL